MEVFQKTLVASSGIWKFSTLLAETPNKLYR
jgi:hypothetical protein